MSALDTQTGGSHYKDCAIQPIEFIHANGLDFFQGNIVKYATRHKAKNGAEDLRKVTREDMQRVYAALLCVVNNRKLQAGEGAIVLALEWLLDPVCKVCKGAGVVVKGEREHKCPKCKGERYRKEPSCRDAQALIDYVQSCKRSHAGEMVRRLH